MTGAPECPGRRFRHGHGCQPPAPVVRNPNGLRPVRSELGELLFVQLVASAFLVGLDVEDGVVELNRYGSSYAMEGATRPTVSPSGSPGSPSVVVGGVGSVVVGVGALLVGDPHPEPYLLLVAVDGDPFGVLPRNDGPLLTLDVLRKRRQAPGEGLRGPRRPCLRPPADGALRACESVPRSP